MGPVSKRAVATADLAPPVTVTSAVHVYLVNGISAGPPEDT